MRPLDQLVEKVLFEGKLYEDLGSRVLAPGTDMGFDPVAGNTATVQQTVKAAPNDTIGEEVPLIPDAVMTTQLTAEMPPVESEEYAPASIAQLGIAIQALANDMSVEEIQKLYRAVRKNINKTVAENVMLEAPKDKNVSSYFDDMTDEELYADMTPEEIEEEKEEIEAMMKNMQSKKASVPWSAIGTKKDPIHKIRGGEEEEIDVEPIEINPEGMNLDDLAKELGLKGASGAKGAVARIVRRLTAVERLMSPKDLTGLQTFATIQYIRQITPFVDEEDVEELKLNRELTRAQDSYRYFLVNSFILPIYNKIYRQARKDIEASIISNGFPKRSANTIANILFGETTTSPEKLKIKIEKDVEAEGSSVDAKELLDRLKTMYSTLRNLAQLSGFDINALARERWNDMSSARKQKEMKSALEDTQAFQDEINEKED